MKPLFLIALLLQLPAGVTSKISGHVLTFPGRQTPTTLTLRVYGPSGNSRLVERPIPVQPDGTFEIAAEPGEYSVSLGDPFRSPVRQILFRSGAVTGLEMKMPAGIPARVVLSDGTPFAGNPFFIDVTTPAEVTGSHPGTLRSLTSRVWIGEPGKAPVLDVFPGENRIKLYYPPAGHRVKPVTLDGNDILQKPFTLDVAPTNSSVVVTLEPPASTAASLAAQSAAPPPSSSPTRVGGEVAAPAKILDVRPIYPGEARSARVEGSVIVDVTVGRDGKVTEVRTSKSIPLLDASAVAAVRQWEFEPTIVNGASVPVIMTTNVDFRLSDTPGASPSSRRMILRKTIESLQPAQNPAGEQAAIESEPSIQFDAKGADFAPWLRRFVLQVRGNWWVPLSASDKVGRVVLTFVIHKDGTISDLKMVTASDVQAFNQSASNAVLASNPTAPLPKEYPDERVTFTVAFYYNEKPPKPQAKPTQP